MTSGERENGKVFFCGMELLTVKVLISKAGIYQLSVLKVETECHVGSQHIHITVFNVENIELKGTEVFLND